jgi:polyhydroxybutyrate depolymerase
MQPIRTLAIGTILASCVACGSDDGGGGSPSGTGGSSTGGSNSGGGSGGGSGGSTSGGTSGGGTGGGPTGGAGGGTGGLASSPGCGKSGAFTGLNEDATIDVGGVTRNFVFSVPDDYDSTKPYPLVFGVHGLNADGKGAHGYLGLEQASGEPTIFVYPSSVSASAGWQMKEGEGDIELWDALVESISDSHCINPARIFSTGFSHGAMFTNNLTCVRLEKLRAIAPIGGSGPWFGSECTGALPAMIIHGKTDGTVVFPDGEATRDHWSAENGCETTSAAYPPDPCVAYDGCQNPVVFCAFDGGHTVPGFAGQAVRDFFATFP